MKRRVFSVFLALCMIVSLTSALSVTASAATVNVVKGISTIKTNTTSTAKYNSNWQYWSQGASAYSAVRSSGCRLVAYAKLLAEIGYTNFGTPDGLFLWGIDNKYFKSKNSVLEYGNAGVLPTDYVKKQSGSSDLKLEGTVSLSSNKNTAAKTIMNYINKGYYVVLFSSQHTAYVGRQASLNYGAPVILDSWSSYTQCASTSQTYGSSYTICTFTNLKYYSYKKTSPPLTVKTTETGSWTVTVPANYKVLCYSSADATASCDYRKPRSSANKIACTQKATLSTGAVRYYYTTDDGRGLWFDYVSGMSVVSNKPTQVLQNGTYYIASALNTNYVLDLTSGSSSNGANIQLYKNSFIDNQSFTVKYLDNGYYEISSVKSGKVLDVASAGKKNGTNVQQYTRNNSDAQKWTLKDAGNGYYYVVSKCNGLYLDVTGGKVANKTNIQMYTGNSSNAQKWKFIPVSTLKIDLTRYPSSIKKGSYYGLRGTVSSNYNLVKVEGHILNSSGKDAIPASVDKPNGKSLNIQTANLNNKLTFNKLAVGTYTMKVIATDTLGKSVTWSKTFKVTK